MVIHVVRPSRGAGVVAEVLGGHRPALWVSDLYGAQQGHADGWQVCLAHQPQNSQYGIGARLYAAIRSVIGTAKRRGIDAYQAIKATLSGQAVLAPC